MIQPIAAIFSYEELHTGKPQLIFDLSIVECPVSELGHYFDPCPVKYFCFDLRVVVK